MEIFHNIFRMQAGLGHPLPGLRVQLGPPGHHPPGPGPGEEAGFIGLKKGEGGPGHRGQVVVKETAHFPLVDHP